MAISDFKITSKRSCVFKMTVGVSLQQFDFFLISNIKKNLSEDRESVAIRAASEGSAWVVRSHCTHLMVKIFQIMKKYRNRLKKHDGMNDIICGPVNRTILLKRNRFL